MQIDPENNETNCSSPNNIHGKQVTEIVTRILNPNSDFAGKKLCDGPTFSAGSACVFSCKYCYVETMMNRGHSAVAVALKKIQLPFQEVVLRKKDPVSALRDELSSLPVAKRDRKAVIFASPAVDVAATMPLANETVELVNVILDNTNWDIRLLSKSPLITHIANRIPSASKHRLIFGLSTGTLDDSVAKAIEPDAPSPSKRLEALRDLQNAGYRTFAMLCPILPQDMIRFTDQARSLIQFAKCEDVWAEVLNRRGKSMTHTFQALENAKLSEWAERLRMVFGTRSTDRWEAYARSTFGALTSMVPENRLHFLQYVNDNTLAWWNSQAANGAIPLGESTEPKIGPSITKPISELESPSVSTVATAGNQQTAAAPFSPARKAWVTMRQRYTPEQIRARAQAAAKKAHETMRKKKGLSANESVMSPVTSKPASRGRIKTSHLEALYSKQVS